jgi:hypothetical protein
MKYDDKMAFNTRRDFLKFIGKAGVSLPLLQASSLGAGMMLSRQAMSAGVDTRRVIFVYVPDGTPGGASSTYLPSDSLVLKTCSAPLEAVKSQCVFFKNLEIDGGGGHGNTQRVLGAFANGVNGKTIDVALGGSIGATSPIASLRLGVLTGNKDPISTNGGNGGYNPVTDMQDNPKAAFEKLFGGVVSTTPIGTKREKKIHDINSAALTQLETKLGTYERQRLEQHKDAIAKLSADIDKAGTGGTVTTGCTNPVWNSGGLSIDQVGAAFTDLFALQTENIVLAMKCNITRVATLQIGTHQSDFGVTGLTGDYHGSVHSGNLDFYASYRSYFSARIAHLIKRLSETDDPNGGKLIDSTLILQVTDMGDGSSHGGTDAPYMMAGGGTAVNRGKVVSVASHHMLLDTVSQYVGAYNAIPHYASAPAAGILI